MAMSFREPNQARWLGVRPAHNGEQVTLEDVKTNGTLILYTVPTGKTLYVTSVWMSMSPTAAGGPEYIGFRDDGDVLVWRFLSMNCATNGFGNDSVAYLYPIEVAGDYDIIIVSSAALRPIRAGFSGWVE